MSINTLTGYLLLCIEKPAESLEFINIAERIAFKLIEKSSNNEASSEEKRLIEVQVSSVESSRRNGELDAIGETQRPEHDGTPHGGDHPSRMEINMHDSGEYEPK